MISEPAGTLFRENVAPATFELLHDSQFALWYRNLHSDFAPSQRALYAKRAECLHRAQLGDLPQHLPPSAGTTRSWTIDLPVWCQEQRNLLSVPSDNRELVVKALNSGVPIVLLDLEDSVVNEWPIIDTGTRTIIAALEGELPDVPANATSLFVRPRGLHIGQRGIIPGETTPASLFDLARIWYRIDVAKLKHPLAITIPKSESAEEALWWRDVFVALAESKRLPRDYIKCMAIDESHPLAYQLEEFAYNLRDHIVGLTLGRLDYMASLIDFNFNDPLWVLPDRNSIPHNVEFYQRLRELIVDISHKHGMLAIGGMTAIFPDRVDASWNDHALRVLESDKRNEAACLMDGAWTGHPDQNEIALRQFPHPNQGFARRPSTPRYPELRIAPTGIGQCTLEGTRAAVSSVLRYRFSVLNGKGAARIDGYMEDMATERIYRLMIAQRVRHSVVVPSLDSGAAVVHDRACVERLFDEELERALSTLPAATPRRVIDQYVEARNISQEAIFRGIFTGV